MAIILQLREVPSHHVSVFNPFVLLDVEQITAATAVFIGHITTRWNDIPVSSM